MRYSQLFVSALPLATEVLGSSAVKARHSGYSPGSKRWADELQANGLLKRATCGQNAGSCAADECCSEGGYCGKTKDYCKSPACQIAYSNGNCDAE